MVHVLISESEVDSQITYFFSLITIGSPETLTIATNKG